MNITLPANGWKPRDYQLPAWKAFMDPNIHTIVLAWARRHGKDDIAMHGTAVNAMRRVGNYYHCLPEYGQARKAIWNAVNPHTGSIRWKEVFPAEIIEHVDNQTMMITFKNGSTWQLIGSDNPDSLMGASPVGIVFSEAALANPATFAFFRPILLENNGWSAHISSVRGKNHFYQLYQALQGLKGAFTSHISANDTTVFTQLALALERQLYVKQFGRAIGGALFDQEYLSSWDSAVVGAVFGEELKLLEEEGRALPLRYDRRYPVDTSWDLGVGDNTVVLFWQTVGNIERLLDWYSATDIGLAHYVEVLRSKPYMYGTHIGPHDIRNREFSTGASRISSARALGLSFTATPNVPKHQSIALVSDMLGRVEINVSGHPVEDQFDDCSFVLEAFKNYRFAYDKEKRVLSKNPVHDWSSHYADALQTKALHAAGHVAAARVTAQDSLHDQNFSGPRLRDLMAAKQGRPGGAWG